MGATVSTDRPLIDREEPATRNPAAARGGYVGLWALVGAVVGAVTVEVLARWMLSASEFRSAPILGPDDYATWRLVLLRTTEAASVVAFVAIVWAAIVRPLRRERRLGVDAMMVIGLLVGCVTDGVLNMFEYIFAWNAHSVNLGSWSSFLPLRSSEAASRYAEALVWGIPMYMYFCFGVAVAGCALVRHLRRRYPGISNARGLAVVFIGACAFDFAVENLIIRTSQAYGFVSTPESVTLWAGKPYQFPIYEMLAVGALGVIFTSLRLSAVDSPDGLSFIDQGVQRFRVALQTPVRVLAHIGFAVVVLLLVYHIPVNWLGTNGDSIARLPSYLRPG